MARGLKYVLSPVMAGIVRNLEITHDEYLAFKTANAQLAHVLEVEDKFDVTIQNYIEFETSIAQESVRDLVEFKRSKPESHRLRRLLARRLSNILSSARLYVETITHHSKIVVASESGGLAKIHQIIRDQYDTSADYRLVEALRNYAQHHALPVHGLMMPFQQPDKELLEYSIDPFIDPDKLRSDGAFKAQVLNELPDDGDVVNLKPVLRSYVESLGAIQSVFRTEVESRLIEIFNLFLSAETAYSNGIPDGGPTQFLAAASKDDEGCFGSDEIIYVASSRQEILEYWGNEFSSLRNLRNRSVRY